MVIRLPHWRPTPPRPTILDLFEILDLLPTALVTHLAQLAGLDHKTLTVMIAGLPGDHLRALATVSAISIDYRPQGPRLRHAEDWVPALTELAAQVNDPSPAAATFTPSSLPQDGAPMTGSEDTPGTPLGADIVALSALIDSGYPDDLDPETHRWRRCVKVSEEAGEVIEALLGAVGENPRKGTTHTLEQVQHELLDVALAALGAVAHLNANNTQQATDPITLLDAHASWVKDRLQKVVDGPDPTSP